MKQAGVSDDFASRAQAVPFDEMWYPTTEELFEAGVITRMPEVDGRLECSMLKSFGTLARFKSGPIDFFNG